MLIDDYMPTQKLHYETSENPSESLVSSTDPAADVEMKEASEEYQKADQEMFDESSC